MREINGYPINKWTIIKGSLIVIILFTLFSFIDLRLAFLVSIVCASLLLTRRMILYLNPGFIKGHRIYSKDTALNVPDGVDIFNLDNVSTIGNLYAYTEVIRNIISPPRILIIRFVNKFKVDQSELETLQRVIIRLKMHKIHIIFSDVNVTIQNQFRENGIAESIGGGNIFYYIKEALKHSAGKSILDQLE